MPGGDGLRLGVGLAEVGLGVGDAEGDGLALTDGDGKAGVLGHDFTAIRMINR